MAPSITRSSTENSDASLKKPSFLKRISNVIIGGLEGFFFRYGQAIATRPFVTILICLALVGLCGIGFIKWEEETRPEKLWIPDGGQYIEDTQWIRENLPAQYRFQTVIVTADNVLTPEALDEMNKIRCKVNELRLKRKGNYTFQNQLCAKLPVIPPDTTGGFTDSFSLQNENISKSSIPSGNFIQDTDVKSGLLAKMEPICHEDNREMYCQTAESLPQACYERSLLELLHPGHPGEECIDISTITQKDILDRINGNNQSLWFNSYYDFIDLLGGISRDENQRIVGARAAKMIWVLQINESFVDEDVGTGEVLGGSDQLSMEWEEMFIDAMLDFRLSHLKLLVSAARSFGDLAAEAILGDVMLLTVGYAVVFTYLMITLGKRNMLESRVILVLCGLGSVGCSILSCYGICQGIGIPFGPVHNVLPFLLLGIGIDDMYVIVEAWENLSPEEKSRELNSLPRSIGFALKHAGVGITVTSLTDFAAFAVGATTSIPSLRSFCLYAAVGIIALYLLQATMFTACLSLDQRRLENRRSGCIPCWRVPDDWEVSECSKVDLLQTTFRQSYTFIINNTYIKVLIFLVTMIALGINCYGLVLLEQRFDGKWFLPAGSYLLQFLDVADKLYEPPVNRSGTSGIVVLDLQDYVKDYNNTQRLIDTMRADPDMKSVSAWTEEFNIWMTRNCDTGFEKPDFNETGFRYLLSLYLYAPDGTSKRPQIRFPKGEELKCSELAPRFNLSTLGFTFHELDKGKREHIEAMQRVRELVNSNPFDTGHVVFWSEAFADWETDISIEDELYQNMGLALLCVAVVTLVLIADIIGSFLTLACVFMTLINVAGCMHWWGLTIDTVSCINMVLTTGLSVDYAAHIAHTFMTFKGTGNQRAIRTLTDIGPAVFNGGFSTFLAFILLASSDSHVFTTFFKLFFCTVCFGLFHGLVFLPAALSIINPRPYDSASPAAPTSVHRKPSQKTDPKVGPGNAFGNPAFQVSPEDFISSDQAFNKQQFQESFHLQKNGTPTPNMDSTTSFPSENPAYSSSKPVTPSSIDVRGSLPTTAPASPDVSQFSEHLQNFPPTTTKDVSTSSMSNGSALNPQKPLRTAFSRKSRPEGSSPAVSLPGEADSGERRRF